MKINRRSNGRRLAVVLSLAAGASIASGPAGAMEAVQADPGSAAVPAAAVSLPAFLDSARVSDLQDAWRARFGFADAKPVTSEVEVINSKPNPDAVALQSARDAMTRAEQVSRDTAVVRARAEALSARFEEPAASQNQLVTHAVATVPVTARTGDLPPPMMIGAPPPAELPPQPAVLAPDDDAGPTGATDPIVEAAVSEPEVVRAVEDEEAKPAKRAKNAASGVSPSHAQPETAKAAKTARPARRVVQAESQSSGLFGLFSSWGSSGDEPAEPVAEEPRVENSNIPTEFQAFGWNAQPNGSRYGSH